MGSTPSLVNKQIDIYYGLKNSAQRERGLFEAHFVYWEILMLLASIDLGLINDRHYWPFDSLFNGGVDHRAVYLFPMVWHKSLNYTQMDMEFFSTDWKL